MQSCTCHLIQQHFVDFVSFEEESILKNSIEFKPLKEPLEVKALTKADASRNFLTLNDGSQ